MAKATKNKLSFALSKNDDGTIQIIFTIPYKEIETARKSVAQELKEKVEVPGFRKGKAPLDKILARIPENTLLEKSLQKILTKALDEAIKKYKIKPAIYPKFELISVQEGRDWQIKAITCELPKVRLNDYKKIIIDEVRTSSIWTPDKAKGKEKSLTKEEKEQQIIKALLKNIKVEVPAVLIEEEVTRKLSGFLENLEKLGLSLDSYLASTGKTAKTLREEYEIQAKEAISLELILNKIAEEERIDVGEDEIEAVIKAASTNPEQINAFTSPEQKRVIKSILRKRAVLDSLASLL